MDKRDNLIFYNEDGDSMITILYPTSSYYDNNVIVVYEDAYGEVEMKIMTPDAVRKNYECNFEEIELFISTQKQKDIKE